MGIYISEFSESMGIEKIAEKLAEELPLEKYKEVYVYGQCVGCMPALEFAERIGERLKCLTLVSPSVKTDLKIRISPWRFLPDSFISGMLVKSGGRKINCSENALARFRCDTERYFRYKPRRYNLGSKCRINVIYGDNDIFVKDGRKTAERTYRLTGIKPKVYKIKGGKHFLNETHSKVVSDIINKS
ncbi:MAG: hypothetical protein LUD77_04825 [Clostridiales bacterium]|nr:hypothetical protein [Clostridiales bacterium]